MEATQIWMVGHSTHDLNLPPSWGDEMNNVVQRKTQWGEGWAKPDVAVCEARPARQAWNHGLLLPCRGCLNAQRRPDGHSASHLQHVFSGAAGGLCSHRDYILHAQLLKHQTCNTNCYCKGAELGWESGSSHWFFSSPSTQRRSQVLACYLPSLQVDGVRLDCIFCALNAFVKWTGVMNIYLLSEQGRVNMDSIIIWGFINLICGYKSELVVRDVFPLLKNI